MTPEELRQKNLAGIDKALGYHWLLTAEAVTLLKAHKIYWTQDDGSGLDKLLAILQGPPANGGIIPWILEEKMAYLTVSLAHSDTLKARLDALDPSFWTQLVALAEKYGGQVFLMAEDFLPYLEGTQKISWQGFWTLLQKWGPLFIVIYPDLLKLFGL